jgi:glycosyltransferase involved in cell wall biosynthesis
VSNIPANREAVQKDCGIVFEVRNIESLKKELAYIVNRPAEAREIGRAARKRVENYYGWDAIAERTLEVYQNLLEPRNLKHHVLSQK